MLRVSCIKLAMLPDINVCIRSITLRSMSALRKLSSNFPKSPACMQPGMYALGNNRKQQHACEEGASLLEGQLEAWQGPLLHLASSEEDGCGQACGMRALCWVLRP